MQRMESQSQSNQDMTSEQQKGRWKWTDEEHHKFLQGLQLYGKRWNEIQAFVGTRICAQVRSHAQKFFKRMRNRTLQSSVGENEEFNEGINESMKDSQINKMAANPKNNKSQSFDISNCLKVVP